MISQIQVCGNSCKVASQIGVFDKDMGDSLHKFVLVRIIVDVVVEMNNDIFSMSCRTKVFRLFCYTEFFLQSLVCHQNYHHLFFFHYIIVVKENFWKSNI